MKTLTRILILSAAAVTISLSASAQAAPLSEPAAMNLKKAAAPENRFTISAGTGFLSADEYLVGIFIALGNGISISADKRYDHQKSHTTFLNPYVTGEYALSERWALAVTASYSISGADGYDADGQIFKSYRYHFARLMAGATLTYTQSSWLKFYGEYGAGALYIASDSQNRPTSGDTSVMERTSSCQVVPMINIYPLCLKFGQKYGGVVNLGVGVKGVVNVGMFVTF